MSEINPAAAPQNPDQWTSDELGEWIVEQTNLVAQLPDRAVVAKQLLTVLAAHMTENQRTAIPIAVYEREVLGAFLSLERRIVAIEHALIRGGTDLPPATL